jgi:hypothetical protein
MSKNSRKVAIVASLIGALFFFGNPAFADEDGAREDATVQKAKDDEWGEKGKGKDGRREHAGKKEDGKKEERNKEGDKKEEGRRGEHAGRWEDGRHDDWKDRHDDGKGRGDEWKDRHDGRRDHDWKDREHRDERNRDWDHDRDRHHRRHDWDTHRRYYRYGYYGPGYYDDCGYYGHGYRGYGDDYYYYGPDACSYEYGDYGSHYLVRMSGEEIVPHRGARDAHGRANLDINAAAGRVCFRLAYDGIEEATGAQIRYGRSGENGPAVVFLHVGHHGDDGCVAADPRVLDDIRKHPEVFYLRVDSHRYPDGAMRGQLVAPRYYRY